MYCMIIRRHFGCQLPKILWCTSGPRWSTRQILEVGIRNVSVRRGPRQANFQKLSLFEDVSSEMADLHTSKDSLWGFRGQAEGILGQLLRISAVFLFRHEATCKTLLSGALLRSHSCSTPFSEAFGPTPFSPSSHQPTTQHLHPTTHTKKY